MRRDAWLSLLACLALLGFCIPSASAGINGHALRSAPLSPPEKHDVLLRDTVGLEADAFADAFSDAGKTPPPASTLFLTGLRSVATRPGARPPAFEQDLPSAPRLAERPIRGPPSEERTGI